MSLGSLTLDESVRYRRNTLVGRKSSTDRRTGGLCEPYLTVVGFVATRVFPRAGGNLDVVVMGARDTRPETNRGGRGGRGDRGGRRRSRGHGRRRCGLRCRRCHG